MTVEPQCLVCVCVCVCGGGGGLSHPLQLTTGLVINSSVTTSPTLAGEHMLLIPKVSILSEQIKIWNVVPHKEYGYINVQFVLVSMNSL